MRCESTRDIQLAAASSAKNTDEKPFKTPSVAMVFKWLFYFRRVGLARCRSTLQELGVWSVKQISFDNVTHLLGFVQGSQACFCRPIQILDWPAAQ